MKNKCNASAYMGIILAATVLVLTVSFHQTLAAEPINVGFTTDFSGPTATLTMVEAPVVEMAVKEVNAAGGINGRQINLIIQDNGSDPAKALGNVKMFKEQYHAKVIIAGVVSSVAIALKGWADKNHVPIIMFDPQTDKVWQKTGKAWFFRTSPPASLLVHATLARLKKLGYTKVAFEGTTLAWGTDTLATTKELAPSYGIQIVSEILSDIKTKDLTIQAKQMKDSGAQALICCDYEAETVVLARAMASVGWKPFVIDTSAANVHSSITMGTPGMFDGWEVVSIADSTKPLVREIWAKTAAFAGKKIEEDEKAPRTYDAIALLIAALKASGNPDDSTAIRDAFYNLPNYERATGTQGGKGGFVVGKNHLMDVEGVVIYTVKEGKYSVVK